MVVASCASSLVLDPLDIVALPPPKAAYVMRIEDLLVRPPELGSGTIEALDAQERRSSMTCHPLISSSTASQSQAHPKQGPTKASAKASTAARPATQCPIQFNGPGATLTLVCEHLTATQHALVQEVGDDRQLQLDSHARVLKHYEDLGQNAAERRTELVAAYNVLAEFCSAFQITIFPITPVKVALCLVRFLPTPVGDFLRRTILPAPICPQVIFASFEAYRIAANATQSLWYTFETFVKPAHEFPLTAEILRACFLAASVPPPHIYQFHPPPHAMQLLDRPRSASGPLPVPRPASKRHVSSQHPQQAVTAAIGHSSAALPTLMQPNTAPRSSRPHPRPSHSDESSLVGIQQYVEHLTTIFTDLSRMDKDPPLEWRAKATLTQALKSFNPHTNPPYYERATPNDVDKVYRAYSNVCYSLSTTPHPIEARKLAIFALAHSPGPLSDTVRTMQPIFNLTRRMSSSSLTLALRLLDRFVWRISEPLYALDQAEVKQDRKQWKKWKKEILADALKPRTKSLFKSAASANKAKASTAIAPLPDALRCAYSRLRPVSSSDAAAVLPYSAKKRQAEAETIEAGPTPSPAKKPRESTEHAKAYSRMMHTESLVSAVSSTDDIRTRSPGLAPTSPLDSSVERSKDAPEEEHSCEGSLQRSQAQRRGAGVLPVSRRPPPIPPVIPAKISFTSSKGIPLSTIRLRRRPLVSMIPLTLSGKRLT